MQSFHSNLPIVPGNKTYLERPHIYHLLEQALCYPLVMVTAGAGYGKTQAVYSFLRQYNAITIWLQLSERDNLQLRFWENLTMTIASHIKETLVHFKAMGFPETERQYDRFLDLLMNSLNPHMKYVFVFDDLHLIQERSVFHFLERFVTMPLSNVTSIILSRNEININTKALDSRGLRADITEDDLRFSQEEISKYFLNHNIKVSSETLSSLYHDTEGWAFALNLIVLSLKNSPVEIEHIKSSVKLKSFKLLEGEVFSNLSKDLQQYLIKLSLIEQWPKELLIELAQTNKLIQEMEQINSFIRYDAYLKAYRIHHVFLKFLTVKQYQLSEEDKQKVYEKAAEWCTLNNLKMDAVHYYEKAGDYQRIIDTIYYSFPQLISHATGVILLEVTNRLILKAQDKGIEEDKLIMLRYVVRPRLLISVGRFEESIRECNLAIKTFETLPATPLHCHVLFFAHIHLGFISIYTSIHAKQYEYEHFFKQAYHYFTLCPVSVTGPITSTSISAYVCRVGYPAESGAFEKFMESFTRVIPYVVNALSGCSYGVEDLARTEIALFKGDIKKCEAFANTTLQKARMKRQYEIENRALFFLLRMRMVGGDSSGIQDILKQLESQLEMTEYVNRYILYDIITGWFYAHIGMTGKLASWLRNDFEESDLNPLIHGMEIMVKVKCQFAEKRYAAVLAALQTLENDYGPKAFLLGNLEMKILEALCLNHIKDQSGAAAALCAAYDMAAPNALDMPFIEMGKDMRTLISTVIKDKSCTISQSWLEMTMNKSAAYAKKLFTVAKAYRQQDHQPHASSTLTLSKREQEILIGLSQGLTREEQAHALSISINTVKSIIKSLYIKLGAINRADAIRIATTLGMLKK